MTDPAIRILTVLRRLRFVETDEARRGLAEALSQETALAGRNAGMRREIGEALQVCGGFDRDAFSVWLGRMRAAQARLAEAMRDAEARTETARAALANHRVAETAAEDALGRAMTIRAVDAARRGQIMLEDVARGLARAAGVKGAG
jgi:hypothetical protein